MKEKFLNMIHGYVSSNNEFSKRFTISIRNFMFIHVSVSLIAVIVLTVMGVDAFGVIDILTAMMPVYIALQGANYVKSGFENWKKIGASREQDDCEDG